MVEWCKEALAGSRRPYGVDHFDLVLALRCGERVISLNFDRLRVQQLYGEVLPQQVIAALRAEIGETRTQIAHLAAGLFSWGEALHGVLGSREQLQGQN